MTVVFVAKIVVIFSTHPFRILILSLSLSLSLILGKQTSPKYVCMKYDTRYDELTPSLRFFGISHSLLHFSLPFFPFLWITQADFLFMFIALLKNPLKTFF
jgi:hypothetical protein